MIREGEDDVADGVGKPRASGDDPGPAPAGPTATT